MIFGLEEGGRMEGGRMEDGGGQNWKVWKNFGLYLAKTGFFLEFEVVKKMGCT